MEISTIQKDGLLICTGDSEFSKYKEKRQSELLCVKTLSSQLFRRLGVKGEISRGSGGEPLFPEGLAGSVSHCPIAEKQFRVCVAASNSHRTIGIDIESASRIKPGSIAAKMIVDAKESRIIEVIGSISLVTVFSAKESIYKALFPIVRKKFWFDAVRVESVNDSILIFRPQEQLISFGWDQTLKVNYSLWPDDRTVFTSVSVL